MLELEGPKLPPNAVYLSRTLTALVHLPVNLLSKLSVPTLNNIFRDDLLRPDRQASLPANILDDHVYYLKVGGVIPGRSRYSDAASGSSAVDAVNRKSRPPRTVCHLECSTLPTILLTSSLSGLSVCLTLQPVDL